MEAPFRVGVIGAGVHGGRYLRHALADVPGLRPTVLCRRDRAAGEALARETGVRYEADAARLIDAADVDGVLVATPPSSHLELARAVLAAGKPLLLEKPLTATLDEARALARLDADGMARGAPPLMLAQTLRWNPVVRRARQLWPTLGPVRLVRLAQRLEPTALAWQQDPATAGGGSVLLTGVHIFDLARFLTGHEVVAVDSRQRSWRNHACEDLFLARAELDDGTLVSFEVSKFGRTRGCLLEAVGEAGQLLADYLFGGLRVIRGREVTTDDVSAAPPTLPLVLGDWLACARDPRRPAPPVTARDGLRTLEIVAACYRSHRERREIAIADL
jgi:predicted dehydrogenase